MNDPEAVVIVEWADVAEHVLPEDRVIIKISTTSDDSRELEVTLSPKYNYLRGEQ